MRPCFRSLVVAVLLLSVLPTSAGFAQEYLRVLDPQRTWMRDAGTIEEAVLSVRPKGIYMEYGLYLTFSARGTQFASASTPLEVEYFFTLPEEAVITDSWLWVEGEIIRAAIMDQWTASSIYEDIVDRQRDPSILFKRGQGRYELRVYPMAGNSSRKVKITFLMPTSWSATTVSSAIPMGMLRTSRTPLDRLDLLTWTGGTWSNPRLVEQPGIAFAPQNDPELGSFLEAAVHDSALQGSLTYAVDAPLDSGLFVSRTQATTEGWYQMALLPSRALASQRTRKVAFAIDYDATRTNLGRQQILDALRAQVLSTLSAADSFNVFYSRLGVERAADSWLSADAATVQATFAELTPGDIGTYSSLASLLAESIAFVEDAGAGSVVLLSSSDHLGDAEVANEVLRDLRVVAPSLPPVHVSDFADRNLTTYHFGGQTHTANSYLFTNLAKLSGGTYLTLRSPTRSFSALLAESFDALSGFINAFDLYTTLANGFNFARFEFGAEDDVVLADRPILQVGRYYGDFPFIAEMSGLYQSEPFSQRYTLPADAVHTSDSTLVSLWTGQQIRALEMGTQTNDVINEVINYSLSQRVLSLHTAFLALEPSRGGEVCYDCKDESAAVPTEDEIAGEEDVLTAYPNPFRDQVTIDVRLARPADAAQVTATIYNVMGQTVRVLRPGEGGVLQQFTLTWDGTDASGVDVASGPYLFVLQTPDARHTLSLVKVR